MKYSLYILLSALIITSLLVIQGCVVEPDSFAPRPPRGVRTVTGNGKITIYWEPNTERDLDFYKVYWSPSATGKYEYIGSTDIEYFVDDNRPYGLTNGKTYYYAVTAVDIDGNESDLSKEIVKDTPRPDGYNFWLYEGEAIDFTYYSDYNEYRGTRGAMVRPFDPHRDYYKNEIYPDVYFWVDQRGTPYLTGVSVIDRYDSQGRPIYIDTYIQEFGPTSSLEEVDWAQPDSWWTRRNFEVILKPGYTYLIWTIDNHFAAIRVFRILTEPGTNALKVILDWSYQTDYGNPELSIQQ